MVGGSGLYEKSVINGLSNFPKISQNIKENWISIFREKGLFFLQKKLKQKDLTYYNNVDINNPHRLIRALTIIEFTGKPFSSFLKKNSISQNFRLIRIGLLLSRENIYQRINYRVDKMIKMGLLEEAKKLYPYRHLNALQTVGYRELFQYFDGNSTFLDSIEEIKKNTRRYAKRQLTWYKKDTNINWFFPKNWNSILEFIQKKLNN